MSWYWYRILLGTLAHVLYSIPVTAWHPRAVHRVAWVLVPWRMFYLILICLLLMVFAHSLYLQILQLKQVLGCPTQDLTSEFYMMRQSSVADPDPPDPHVFGPPGSGSTSQRYGSGSGSCSGSGSLYHRAKKVRKTLIPTIL
jgi:hypothetical protein